MSNKHGTNTGHGHVWERPDGLKAKCGGPRICDECAKDAASMTNKTDGLEVVAWYDVAVNENTAAVIMVGGVAKHRLKSGTQFVTLASAEAAVAVEQFRTDSVKGTLSRTIESAQKRITQLEAALKYLLDEHYSYHNCHDIDCPVFVARTAIATAEKENGE